MRRNAWRGETAQPKAGFSLIEALIVLVISGMALMLVFSIGARATETGFRLGRSALGLADQSVSSESYRVIIEGLVVAPANVNPATFRVRPLVGTSDRLESDAVLAKSTACAPAGPARDIHLEIAPVETGSQLLCRVGDADPVMLFQAASPLVFSYSEDGVVWTDDWTNDIPAIITPSDENAAVLHEQHLFVRITARDGDVELLGLARSGRPQLYFARQLEWIL